MTWGAAKTNPHVRTLKHFKRRSRQTHAFFAAKRTTPHTGGPLGLTD